MEGFYFVLFLHLLHSLVGDAVEDDGNTGLAMASLRPSKNT